MKRALFAALVMGAGLLVVAAPARAEPEATIDEELVARGSTLIVRGAGWEPGSLLTVEICGNNALDRSADCDQRNSISVGVDDAGEFSRGIRVTEPPTLCPCVVRITSQSSTDETTVPVDIAGVADVEPRVREEVEGIDRMIDVSGVGLEGNGPWMAWLGGGAERTLVFEVTNVGDVAIDDPPLTLAVGKGEDPTGVVVAPDLGRLEPGETRAYEVPVELDPLSFGGYTVTGRIDGLGEPVAFDARTSTYPWILLLVPAIIVLQFLLIRGRNWLRSRIAEPEVEPESAPLALPAAGAAGAVAAGAVDVDLVAAEAAEAAEEETPVQEPVQELEPEPVPVGAQPAEQPAATTVDDAQAEELVKTPVGGSQEESDSYAAWIAALREPGDEPFGSDESLESLESPESPDVVEIEQLGATESTSVEGAVGASGLATAGNRSGEPEEEPEPVVVEEPEPVVVEEPEPVVVEEPEPVVVEEPEPVVVEEPEPVVVEQPEPAPTVHWSRVSEPNRAMAGTQVPRRERKFTVPPPRRDTRLEGVSSIDESTDSPAAQRRSRRSGGRQPNGGKWTRVKQSAER